MMTMIGHPEKIAVVGTKRRSAGGRWFRRALLLAAVCSLLAAAGFAYFVADVIALRETPVTGSRADGIVVLTGGYARLEPAVALLLANRGERLLVSGVNENTSRETLRQALAIDEKTFECCVDVDRAALDTIGNANQTARWAQVNGFKSLLVVTNDYHMPRSLVELKQHMPDVALVPHPVVNGQDESETLARKVDRYRVLVGEYIKYAAATLRASVFAIRLDNDRARLGSAAGW